MRLVASTISSVSSMILLAIACGPIQQNIGSGDVGGTGGQSNGIPDGPRMQVNYVDQIPGDLQQSLASAKAMDGAALQAQYPAPTTQSPAYDATQASGMEKIQASALALNDNELSHLKRNGLVITKRKEFPSFAYGYKTIYAEDLPLYVSADSILEAVHRNFDMLLEQNEQLVLTEELDQMLSGMRARLADASMAAEAKKDADLYLGVAASLIHGSLQPPVASADPNQLSELFELTSKADGHKSVTLFGTTRHEDFSQFLPRGHYTDSDVLKRYFKAMMWLGRVDLRLIETQSDGSQLFFRRQFDAAVALRELLGSAEFKTWQHIDETVGAYVGEHDSMTPKDLDGLMTALGVTTLAEANALSDQQIVDEIARAGWGAQRIASRIIIKGDPSGPTLPLDRSFSIFGQRYTVDSHTFVNVTYDRVADRLMPKPLDAAFAAFANNAALPLLSDEFANASYVAGLAKTRALVDAHEPAYWEGSVYTRWLGALRSLSPGDAAALPSIAKTPAWQNRMLSTQLASWAELRHDTILYVKQSYSTGSICEFPDAYVDPYPEFYARLGTLAEAINASAQGLPESAATLKLDVQTWATNFKGVAANLQKMAEDQLTGTPHSGELMAFINDAVRWDEQAMCGGAIRTNFGGWYLKLYLSNNAGLEYDPVVADVHTQPTDAGGADVGRILHVGTGAPRLMVVTTETCQGPRAYVGLASSYGEMITEHWQRLTDNDWSNTIVQQPFPDVSWMSDLLAQ